MSFRPESLIPTYLLIYKQFCFRDINPAVYLCSAMPICLSYYIYIYIYLQKINKGNAL